MVSSTFGMKRRISRVHFVGIGGIGMTYLLVPPNSEDGIALIGQRR